ncbi:MAG: hypothetical protein TR69_WS6001001476 [candidate division WS6 bacterium OLB20]|uniref:Uncharacterized protein n=1 Tax=candidate division WS6 bacterium OLB20 TaxID=1617426 RepID=A0A136LW31_9BACT|nr:MAG: hypothetical protein TR69_WS6001001476 [candidate division WS6 bacterium OLB20]
MNRRTLIVLTVATVLFVFALSLYNAMQPGNSTSREPLSYPEVRALSEDTSNVDIRSLNEDGDGVRLEPDLDDDAYIVCAEHTCIGSVEVLQDGQWLRLEGKEINITAADNEAFVIPDMESIPRPFRIYIQVYDERAKVISGFYSQEYN